jgi:hypothetical protein
MADRYWACIEVGGCLRTEDIPRFCAAIGINPWEIPGRVDGGRFVFDDCQARYGQFEELETLCRELGLPYARKSEGYCECPPEIVFWRQGLDGPQALLADSDHDPLVPMRVLRDIRDALQADRVADALGLAAAEVVDLDDMPAFSTGAAT